MEKITLNHTDLTISRLCLGTMTFGAQADEATAASLLDCALDHGLNSIDTANVYNSGRSETLLGKLLRGRRDQVILASKVGIKAGDQPDERGLSRSAIVKGIEDSLRRLQTDCLDLYYLHQPDYSVPLEETLQTMDQLVRAGKVRFLGVSNYASWQVCQILWLAEKNGWPAVRIAQPIYNLIARGIEPELLPMCEEFQLFTVAYNPLAGGLLTGKHRREAPLAGTRFDNNQTYQDRYWHQASFDAVRELVVIAQAAERSLVSLALNWLLHHTRIGGVILGASRLPQLEENLMAIAEGPLAAETVAACDQAWAQVRGTSPQYHR